MLPSASLSQGTFYDFDLILADNFARAAKQSEIKHIIYLGGMIPKTDQLSWHLKSRFEVEQTLTRSGLCVTTLRAGLIIGPGGSSFTILQRLIERLPVMICPSWTDTYSQPVDLEDIGKVFLRVLNDTKLQNKTYDIGGPETLTYQSLLKKASMLIKKKRHFLALEIIPMKISRIWVSLITGVPRDLVYPLVLSLKHEMIVSPHLSYPYAHLDLQTSLDESLKKALNTHQDAPLKGHTPIQRDVRSIQRLVLPKGKNAQWVAEEYFRWLPKFFFLGIKISIQDDQCTFHFLTPKIKLLILNLSRERSTPDRQLLYIIGGLLADIQERGRLEFREVLDRKYVMAAIHEFRPALPWYIYRWTQAVLHLIVMKAFNRHLKKIDRLSY
jgi:uncharacterized protein YbjT (DUF2867 family)